MILKLVDIKINFMASVSCFLSKYRNLTVKSALKATAELGYWADEMSQLF